MAGLASVLWLSGTELYTCSSLVDSRCFHVWAIVKKEREVQHVSSQWRWRRHRPPRADLSVGGSSVSLAKVLQSVHLQFLWTPYNFSAGAGAWSWKGCANSLCSTALRGSGPEPEPSRALVGHRHAAHRTECLGTSAERTRSSGHAGRFRFSLCNSRGKRVKNESVCDHTYRQRQLQGRQCQPVDNVSRTQAAPFFFPLTPAPITVILYVLLRVQIMWTPKP